MSLFYVSLAFLYDKSLNFFIQYELAQRASFSISQALLEKALLLYNIIFVTTQSN